MIDDNGICLAAELSTNKCLFLFDGLHHQRFKLNRCRWSPVIGDASVFIKYNQNKLNVLDTTKMELIFNSPRELDTKIQRKSTGLIVIRTEISSHQEDTITQSKFSIGEKEKLLKN